MPFSGKPIGQKLRTVTLLVIGAVLIINRVAYFAYELVSFRQSERESLETVGKIIASNSTAALAFDSRDDAIETLLALEANTHIVEAALYDADQHLFAWYPQDTPPSTFPSSPGAHGYRFESAFLLGFQPVSRNDIPLGTLYLKSDTTVIYEHLVRYGVFALLIIGASFVIAVLLINRLHKQITRPILDLAGTARIISRGKDFGVRAKRQSNDETGLLTDAFNQMLERIEIQNDALRESAARVRAVMDSSLSGVVVFDAEGTIIDWNRRAEQMFGWSKQEAIGSKVTELIIPERLQQAQVTKLREFIDTGRATTINRLFESTALRRDRNEFPVELLVSPLKAAEQYTFCGFITDITERKEAEKKIRTFNQELEQKVRERTSELEEANRELESFSYSVSHDLRAPLRSVHGYMNIFAETYMDTLDDEGRRLVNTVLKNSKLMGQLIDDLLAFSRLGRKDLARTPVSMEQLVKNTWDEQRQEAPDRNVELVLRPLPDAFADISTIRQVWTNLISNALKYTREKEKAIIEIGAEDHGQDTVYFIRDNGAGFNMAYYDKLFGVFQRLHTPREFEGTGVGLAIVHRIIVKHGGRVWAEGKPGGGATFYFSLSAPENPDAVV